MFCFSFTQPFFTRSKFCLPNSFLFGATPALNNDRSLTLDNMQGLLYNHVIGNEIKGSKAKSKYFSEKSIVKNNNTKSRLSVNLLSKHYNLARNLVFTLLYLGIPPLEMDYCIYSAETQIRYLTLVSSEHFTMENYFEFL
jgi:hypothetical protein